MLTQVIPLLCAMLGLCAMTYWAGRMDGRDAERRRAALEVWKAHEELKAREEKARLARQKAIKEGHLTELWKVN